MWLDRPDVENDASLCKEFQLSLTYPLFSVASILQKGMLASKTLLNGVKDLPNVSNSTPCKCKIWMAPVSVERY